MLTNDIVSFEQLGPGLQLAEGRDMYTFSGSTDFTCSFLVYPSFVTLHRQARHCLP